MSNNAGNKSKANNPRKFAEKIALLNKKEAEGNAEFERIIKEVEETTRSPVLGNTCRSPSGSCWLDAPANACGQPMAIYDNDSQASFDSFVQQYEPNTTTQHDPQHMQQVHHHHLNDQQHHRHQDRNHMSFQTPTGLPNIKIYSTDDDSYGQQQVTSNSRDDCTPYNSISASRSLPDIANLRMSGTCLTAAPAAVASTQAATTSYSQQRLLDTGNYNDASYNYDANSNIVSNGQQPIQTEYAHTTTIPQHQQQEIAQSCWQQQDQFNHHLNNDNNNSNQTQTLHQSYYHNQPQQQTQHGFMVRANSTNAVLSAWQETNETLDAPRLNNHLSKSSDGCYGGYCEDNSSSSYGANFADTNNDHATTTSIRARSSSYNNIGSFRSMPYVEQNTFLEAPRYQFYE